MEPLLTPKEAGELLRMSGDSLRAHARAGRIPWVVFGARTKRFRPSDVREYAERLLVVESPSNRGRGARSVGVRKVA